MRKPRIVTVRSGTHARADRQARPPVARDVGCVNSIGGEHPLGRGGCSTGFSFRRRRSGRTSTHHTGNLRHALRCSAGQQSSGSQIGGSPRMATRYVLGHRRSRGLATVRKLGARRRASTHVTPGGRRTGRRSPGTRGGRATARTRMPTPCDASREHCLGFCSSGYGLCLSRNARVENGPSHCGWGTRGGSGKYSPTGAARSRGWTSRRRLAREKHDPGPRIVQPSFWALREARPSGDKNLLFLHDRGPQRLRLAPSHKIFTPGPIPWRAGRTA